MMVVFLVKDAINRVGDAKDIPITRELLRFVKEAHSKAVIEDELRKQRKEEESKRRKDTENQKALADEQNLIELKIR